MCDLSFHLSDCEWFMIRNNEAITYLSCNTEVSDCEVKSVWKSKGLEINLSKF